MGVGLGFRMNKKLLALTLLALLMPILFFGLVSCMKKPNHKADYGPEVAPNEVENAIKELGDPDPFSINKGEFSYHETTQALDTQAPMVVLQKAQTVTNKVENAHDYVFTLVTEINEYINGSMHSSKEEANLSLEKRVVNSLSSAAADNDAPIYVKQGPVTFKSMIAKEDETKKRVTYHNLKKSPDFFPIPDAVRARPDCGGLADCGRSLRVMKISVDQVIWESDERGQKTSYEFITSPDVPYFSFELLSCAQSWIDYEGRVLSVRQCQSVKDFKKGTP